MRVLLSSLVGLGALVASAQPVLVDRIAAVVDGRPVFHSEVVRRASGEVSQARSAEAQRKAYEKARGDLVDAALIAKDLGFSPTDTEVDAAIEEVSKSAKLDRAGLEAAVKQQGLSFAEYRESLKAQLLEMRWLLTRARERSVSVSKENERAALRTELLTQLRKRAVIEVFE